MLRSPRCTVSIEHNHNHIYQRSFIQTTKLCWSTKLLWIFFEGNYRKKTNLSQSFALEDPFRRYFIRHLSLVIVRSILRGVFVIKRNVTLWSLAGVHMHVFYKERFENICVISFVWICNLGIKYWAETRYMHMFYIKNVKHKLHMTLERLKKIKSIGTWSSFFVHVGTWSSIMDPVNRRDEFLGSPLSPQT